MCQRHMEHGAGIEPQKGEDGVLRPELWIGGGADHRASFGLLRSWCECCSAWGDAVGRTTQDCPSSRLGTTTLKTVGMMDGRGERLDGQLIDGTSADKNEEEVT